MAEAAAAREDEGGGNLAATYTWEQTDRSWEDLQEDESGQLHDAQVAAHFKRQRLEYASRSAKRRMVRYVTLLLDLSVGLNEHDLRPNRYSVFHDLVAGKEERADGFVDTFFDQNPVSQLGVVGMRDKRALEVSQMSGSPSQHKKKVAACFAGAEGGSGQPSLMQGLLVAAAALLRTPTYGSREILVLYGSTHTVDSGDIHHTIRDLADHGIRVSVVGVGASLHVCQVLAERTQGVYHVGGDEAQLREHLLFHATPPPLTAQMLRDFPAELIEMGFPRHMRSVRPQARPPASTNPPSPLP